MNHRLSRWQDPALTILNVFLRGERDAVAAYDRVIDTRGHDGIPELPRCLNSHRKRVELLRLWIIHEGGYPTAEADAWEFCRIADSIDDPVMDNRATIVALELGEIHVRGIYQAGLECLDAKSQRLVTFAIVPEQVRMLKIINIMKYSIG
jgi:hypothetical protein